MDFEFIRGDTFRFKFKLYDRNQNVLKLSDEDELYFTMKSSANKTNFVLQKRYSRGEITEEDDYYYITLTHLDTGNLKSGNYVYDIQLTSNELVKTLVEGNITLSQDVTHVSNE